MHDADTAFGHHLHQVAVGEPVADVPAHAQNDNLGIKPALSLDPVPLNRLRHSAALRQNVHATVPNRRCTRARNLCREEFALKHRYVMALHTDEPHPHVHVVIKAMGELGKRLNTKKATLREWRRGFARHLNDLGVDANATQSTIRGVTGLRKLNSIYRPMCDPKRHSTHLRTRAEAVAMELSLGKLVVEPGKAKMLRTRKLVEAGWRAVHDALVREGRPALARQVKLFVDQMVAPRTDKELIASKLLEGMQKSKDMERDLIR